MSFRPPWKHQEEQNANWVRQGSGYRNKQFYRRPGMGSAGDMRDQDRRTPWASNRQNNFSPNKDPPNRIPSLLELPPVQCSTLSGIWEQPPAVFETNTQSNRPFSTPESSQSAPLPVPPPSLLPPPAVPLSLLLEGEMWNVNNGQARSEGRGNLSTAPNKQNVELNIRREIGASESHSVKNEPERKPETDELLDSLNRYHEEFQMKFGGNNSNPARSESGSSSEHAPQPSRETKNVENITQKLLNRVALMEKHNIKQVINDPEPKYESALKKRATQLIRANVRQRLRHFSAEETAEQEGEQRGIEADEFVDSDKVPEIVFNEIKNILGLDAPEACLDNSIDQESMFMEFDRAIEENLPLDGFNTANHETTIQTDPEDFTMDEQTIKENVPLNRTIRESTEMLGDANTLDSVMNEAVDANALSPLMAQNEEEHNIRAFADNGIAIPAPHEEMVQDKKDRIQSNLPNIVPLTNNTNEPISKELQSYKIPKKARYSYNYRRDNRHSSSGRRNHDDRSRRHDRKGGRNDSRGSSHSRDERRSRERDSNRNRSSSDRSRRTPERKPPEPEIKHLEPEKKLPEPEEKPPESERKPPPEPEKKPHRPRPQSAKKHFEDNRKRLQNDHPDSAMAKKKKMEKSRNVTDGPNQRVWLSPGEKKCLPQETNDPALFGPKYKNKSVQTLYHPASPTKSLAERELKIFHEMKQIDTNLMEMQRKKIEIDEQIQKLQSELMSIEMQSMKLQNTRFDLLNLILTIPVANAEALVESDFEPSPMKKKPPAEPEGKECTSKAFKMPEQLNKSTAGVQAEVSSGGTKKKKKPAPKSRKQPQNPQIVTIPAENQVKEVKSIKESNPKIEIPKPNPLPAHIAPKEKKISKPIKVKIGPAKKKSPAPTSSPTPTPTPASVAKVPEELPKIATPEPPPPPTNWSKILKDCSVHVVRYTTNMIQEIVEQPVDVKVEKEATKEKTAEEEESAEIPSIDSKEQILSTEWKNSLESAAKSPIIHMEVASGRVFAAAEDDTSLYCFSWNTEDHIKSLQLHQKPISSFVCHENGFVFTIAADGFVRKSDCREFTGSLQEFHCGGQLEIISVASWGQLYVVRHDKKIFVFDAQNLSDNRELNCETGSKIVGVVGSEVDGQRVISVASQGNEFSIRNAESGELIRRFHLEWTIDYFTGHNHVIQCGIDGKDLIHYRIMTGEEIARCNIGTKVTHVKHLSGMIFILCNNGAVYVWNCAENQFIGVVKGPKGVIIKGFDIENNKIFIVTSQNVFWSCELPKRLLNEFLSRKNNPELTDNFKIKVEEKYF